MAKLVISETNLKMVVRRLMEEKGMDVDSDVDDLTTRTDDFSDELEDMSDILDDDTGRVGYIRQLTAELLDYLQSLNNELSGQVDIPLSSELMDKIMSRTGRKRYYMSKFRL